MNVEAIFSMLATFAWLATLIVIVVVIVRAGRGAATKGATWYIIGLAVKALILTIVSAGMVFVQPTERGVVISALDEGVRDEVAWARLRFSLLPLAPAPSRAMAAGTVMAAPGYDDMGTDVRA